ncbi:TetR/AcrR family transcriptional regulator [Shewanella halotolerans]|uniref:TetR/AcrR family transcriptional regulator n=1 Tax=Shewanella halotolerans TaxID=2864204 RepID=UPI001C65CDD2|nr:TetR family transcriptional regulator [Shewanella halotolerans]QYJ91009.1 TetR/AcrR family transcriptional regulator [Shewanella halotolerans]
MAEGKAEGKVEGMAEDKAGVKTEGKRAEMSLRERKKQQMRQTLLDIAEELFSTLPFEEVMVDEITARANISQKTFFNYFPTKAQLLEELLLSWLRQVNLWPLHTEGVTDIRSALVPPNLPQIQEWVIAHRHVLQMIMRQTELFSSVYYSSQVPAGKNLLFPPEYRQPRVDRVKWAQELGLIRGDIAPQLVCEMYDLLRVDIVQRWLCMPDEQANGEIYKRTYEEMVAIFFRGLQPDSN